MNSAQHQIPHKHDELKRIQRLCGRWNALFIPVSPAGFRNSQCVSAFRMFCCVHVLLVCVCLCVCTKFQLLNECNGILFQCIVVGLLWVFCSELNSMELGPLVLFCHFSMLQKHPFSIVFNHTHTTFTRFYFASFLKRCRSLSVCVCALFSTQYSVCTFVLLLPLNFFVLNSLETKCIQFECRWKRKQHFSHTFGNDILV